MVATKNRLIRLLMFTISLISILKTLTISWMEKVFLLKSLRKLTIQNRQTNLPKKMNLNTMILKSHLSHNLSSNNLAVPEPLSNPNYRTIRVLCVNRFLRIHWKISKTLSLRFKPSSPKDLTIVSQTQSRIWKLNLANSNRPQFRVLQHQLH